VVVLWIVAAKDPMGRTHYWFTVVPIEGTDEDTDRWAFERGYVSMTPLRLDLAPGRDLGAALLTAKRDSRRVLGNELAELIPRRLADAWLASTPELADKPLPDQRDRDLAQLAGRLHRWELKPQGSEGYRKAEVTAGGVDTRELSSQTLESRRVPGLHFIGEVVDVTGWLGGYNFQWAWASAVACGKALPPGSEGKH